MKVTGLVQPIKVLMIEQTRPDFAAEGPALYQLELTTMCYEAGRLVRVRHGVPVDVPTLVTTGVLDFELGSWALTVNADDDTIRIATTEELRSEDVRLDDAPAESPWTRALGASVQWIWLLRNQQGYHDGIQFSFAHDGQVDCQIQMIAAASGWHFAAVQHWVPDATSE